MRRKNSTVFVLQSSFWLFAAFLAFPSSGSAIVDGMNDGDGRHHNAVVRVVWENLGGRVTCTGTLVAYDIVLTAGHCIGRPSPRRSSNSGRCDTEEPGRWYRLDNANRVTVLFGVDRDDPLTRRRAVDYSLPDCIDIIALGLDDAVPESMAQPARVATYLRQSDMSDLRRLEIVGWGGTERDSAGGGAPRFRQTGIAFGPPVSCSRAKFARCTRDNSPSVSREGDSGGPVFATVDGRKMLIGVNRGFTEFDLQHTRLELTYVGAGKDNVGQPHVARWLERLLD
jgi:hypothetical protein